MDKIIKWKHGKIIIKNIKYLNNEGILIIYSKMMKK